MFRMHRLRRFRLGFYRTAFLSSVFLAHGSSLYAIDPDRSGDSILKGILAKQARGEVVDRTVVLRSDQNAKNEERWNAGQVFFAGAWHDLEELKPDMMTPKIKEYTERRGKLALNSDDHRKLARWCSLNGLEEQAKAHWMAILEQSTNDAEARKALEHRQIGSTWYSQEVWNDVDQAMTKRMKDIEHWYPKLTKIAKELQSDNLQRKTKALQQLKEIDSDRCAVSLGMLASQIPNEQALPFVNAIRRLDSTEACLALARVAMATQIGPVFDASIEGLKEYREEFFVPELLSLMEEKTELRQRVTQNRSGQFLIEQLWISDTKNEKRVSQLQKYVDTTASVVIGPNVFNGRATAGRGLLRFFLRDPIVSSARKSEFEGQTEKAILDNEVRNQALQSQFQRVANVLSAATGHNPGDNAKAWWDWWDKQNDDQAIASRRTTYESRKQMDLRPISYVTMPLPASQVVAATGNHPECLVAGTAIQTSLGLVPVESIKVGDLVVSSNVTTGELSLQPVTATSVRPPEVIVKIATEEASVHCTAGHRWWISGIGWVRTKDLVPGLVIHTAKGSTEIVEVAVCEKPEPTYNLVVSDNHTYFVGNERWLSSDVTAFQPMPFKVPGFTQESSAKKLIASRVP